MAFFDICTPGLNFVNSNSLEQTNPCLTVPPPSPYSLNSAIIRISHLAYMNNYFWDFSYWLTPIIHSVHLLWK